MLPPMSWGDKGKEICPFPYSLSLVTSGKPGLRGTRMEELALSLTNCRREGGPCTTPGKNRRTGSGVEC